MSMQRLERLALLFAGTIFLVSALLYGGLAYAGQDKVDVCHMSAKGSYHLLRIAKPAFNTHMGHGDSVPGDIVPGSGNRFSFAADCSFIPACPCVADLPDGWQALTGISGIALEICPDGSEVSSVSGSWSDGAVSLGFGEQGRCDGPTLYQCSAAGIVRSISQAQYAICRQTTSKP